MCFLCIVIWDSAVTLATAVQEHQLLLQDYVTFPVYDINTSKY